VKYPYIWTLGSVGLQKIRLIIIFGGGSQIETSKKSPESALPVEQN